MRIQIVDANDRSIGHKERSEVNADLDIYRVSGLWVLNPKEEALIGQRKFNKKNDPGKWGPSAAGTVEEGEDYDSNIYKEAQEEIGLKGVVLTKIAKIHATSPNNYFCQTYAVRVDWPIEKFTAQEEEVEQLKWVNIDSLVKDVSDHPENYIPGMAKSLEQLELARTVV